MWRVSYQTSQKQYININLADKKKYQAVVLDGELNWGGNINLMLEKSELENIEPL